MANFNPIENGFDLENNSNLISGLQTVLHFFRDLMDLDIINSECCEEYISNIWDAIIALRVMYFMLGGQGEEISDEWEYPEDER